MSSLSICECGVSERFEAFTGDIGRLGSSAHCLWGRCWRWLAMSRARCCEDLCWSLLVSSVVRLVPCASQEEASAPMQSHCLALERERERWILRRAAVTVARHGVFAIGDSRSRLAGPLQFWCSREILYRDSILRDEPGYLPMSRSSGSSSITARYIYIYVI